MNILVTGATGFVGSHVVQRLVEEGHQVTAISRDHSLASKMPWFNQVKYFPGDIYQEKMLDDIEIPNTVIHLAWSGLPNFQSIFHITDNLPNELHLLNYIIKRGVKRLIVSGTCLEYGIQSGALMEDGQTNPTTPYGFAKDSIRKFLQLMQAHYTFNLQWVRLFYMFGEGQNPNSLLAQLDAAIDAGKEIFNMSKGDQLRDYLHISEIAERFIRIVNNPNISGVINCSSGRPVSVYDLVVSRCNERGARIHLNRGYYPYPSYESMAFWGVSDKLKNF